MTELVFVTVLKKDYLIQFGQILKMLLTLMLKMKNRAKKKMIQPKKNQKVLIKKEMAKAKEKKKEKENN